MKTAAQRFEELRIRCNDTGVSVSTLLRDALDLAALVGDSEARGWIERELLGYEDISEIPKYRKLTGPAIVLDERFGWIPLRPTTPEQTDLMTSAPCGTAIDELESLLTESGQPHAEFHITMNKGLQRALNESLNLTTEYRQILQRSALARVLHAVRNKLLQWAIQHRHHEATLLLQEQAPAASEDATTFTAQPSSQRNLADSAAAESPLAELLRHLTKLLHWLAKACVALAGKLGRTSVASTGPTDRSHSISDASLLSSGDEEPAHATNGTDASDGSHEAATMNEPYACAIFVTALELEYQAIRNHFPGLQRTVDAHGTVFEEGRFTGNTREWNIVLVRGGVGNVDVATAVASAIGRYSPDVMMFVGVAGGVKDVAIGDIVVASDAYYYESTKSVERELARSRSSSSSHSLVQLAQAEASSDEWRDRIPTSAGPKDNAKVVVGPRVWMRYGSSDGSFFPVGLPDLG